MLNIEKMFPVCNKPESHFLFHMTEDEAAYI